VNAAVLFVYVDSSNLWIEGQRLSAVRRPMAVDAVAAMKRGIVDHDWRIDFGQGTGARGPGGPDGGPPATNCWRRSSPSGSSRNY
jgi:hypothetical protein